MIDDLQIPFDVIPERGRTIRGKHCVMLPCPDWVKARYGRENHNLKLKVFDSIPIDLPYEEMMWGDEPKLIKDRKRPGNMAMSLRLNTPLKDATVIQNICHWHGLAPRVYAIVTVVSPRGSFVAQVTDDVGSNFYETHDEAHVIYKQVVELGLKYGWKTPKDDVNKRDVTRENLLVDFQTFQLTEEHRAYFWNTYVEGTKWGKIYYQECEALGLSGGPRNFKQRVKEMGLDQIDFKGKTVLDIGCSGGNFVKYAVERGAKKVFGIDFEPVAEGARWAMNESGIYNAEILGMDLLKEDTQSLIEKIGMEKFDIVFYLSMFRHVKFPHFIWEMCNDTAILEWNNWKTEKEVQSLVREHFEIKDIKKTTEHGTGKEVYICKPL